MVSLRGIIILYTLVSVYMPVQLHAQEMDNPMILDNEWSGYGIGDPYVLKHRGIFYLYCSTKNGQTGVKCWSSRNLVVWNYEGLCSTDAITVTAYAPEVVYWNGTFYMYTSPGGNGHYVLSAPHPTGPFEAISSNLHKSIDGSVFIDDDASWYFYHASSRGIQGCYMPDPASIGTDHDLNARMNDDWTEGPCMFKRNGVYYLIYTGNHVISKGYRIDYAAGKSGPIDPVTPARLQNPVLLDALGYHVGLGHGSIFIGPDLDSYYLTYHNLVSGSGPFRRLNFDRISWNGEKMIVLGPTDYPQQNPSMPDSYDYFDRSELGEEWFMPSGGQWSIENNEILVQDTIISGDNNWFMAILDSITQHDYTAEFNIRESSRENDDAKLGAVFGYTDQENYGIAAFNSATNQFEIDFLRNNNWGNTQLIELPDGFIGSAWHCMRIEKYLDTFKFMIDGMLRSTVVSEMEGGKIGYMTSHCTGEFDFIAFSNKIRGSGTFDIYKPVPGKLQAMQYIRGGEGTGYHREKPGGQAENILRNDEVDLTRSALGGYALASVGTDDWFNYHINVEMERLYNAEIIYATDRDDGKVRMLVDDADVSGMVELPSTGGMDQWRSFFIKDLHMSAGNHTLKVETENGGFHLYSLELVIADNNGFDQTLNFDGSFGSGWKYHDGDWFINDNNATIDGFGKRTYGSDAWRDYTVETDIMFTRSMNAGLIFRVNNPALGGAGNNPALGTDFLQGYFVGFNFSSIVLGKHNYDWEALESSSGSFSLNEWYHLRAVIADDRIRVFIDDMTEPVIDYRDSLPLINGMAGIRSFNSGVRYDNFRVTSQLLLSSEDNKDVSPQDQQAIIYPNPASDHLNITFKNTTGRIVRIVDLTGATVLTVESEKQHITIPLHELHPGLYILTIKQKSGIRNSKLIII